MEIVLTLMIGILTAGGSYLLLQSGLLRLVIGLALLSQAANLVIFTAGKTQSQNPPVIGSLEKTLGPHTADPLPQALILTAIVIGFAMIAFFVVLIQRVYAFYQTDDIEQLQGSDQ